MPFCRNCGTQLPDGAACPRCAGTTPAANAGVELPDNVAGALAYVTIVPAIVFLVVEPYNKRRFVRFHSFQSILFAVAWTVLWMCLAYLGRIPFLGWITLPLSVVLVLAGFVIWLVLVLKAYEGQTFKLPLISDLAEKQANTV